MEERKKERKRIFILWYFQRLFLTGFGNVRKTERKTAEISLNIGL